MPVSIRASLIARHAIGRWLVTLSRHSRWTWRAWRPSGGGLVIGAGPYWLGLYRRSRLGRDGTPPAP